MKRCYIVSKVLKYQWLLNNSRFNFQNTITVKYEIAYVAVFTGCGVNYNYAYSLFRPQIFKKCYENKINTQSDELKRLLLKVQELFDFDRKLYGKY